MKKLTVLLLTFFYLSSATGATFHMHYCMEKLVDVDLWHGEHERCGSCGACTSCEKDCCKDLHKTVKLEKDTKLTEQQLQLIALVTPVITLGYTQPALATDKTIKINHLQPLRSCKVPPHILHCTFLI